MYTIEYFSNKLGVKVNKIDQIERDMSCIFIIHTESNKYFVKRIKFSKEHDWLSKIKWVNEKVIHNCVKTPIILNSWEDDKWTYIVYEYVEGKTLEEIYNYDGIHNKLAQELYKTHTVNLNGIEFEYMKKSVVEGLVRRLNYSVQDINILDMFRKKLNEFEVGFVHGDITKENIIMNGEDLIIIDFLYEHIQHFMFDLVPFKFEIFSDNHEQFIMFIDEYARLMGYSDDIKKNIINNMDFFHLVMELVYNTSEEVRTKIVDYLTD